MKELILLKGWEISLIVIASVIVVSLVLLLILFIYAGKKLLQTLKKSDGFKGVKVDISFYENGKTKPLMEEGVEYIDTLNKEDIFINSFDGLKLQAYYFKNPYKESKRYFLGMHGFKSGPLREYAPYIRHYFELGFNVILPCERAHYRSEGTYITMGIKERYDVLSWTNNIVSKFGEDIEILIQGISMGAASVCLAADLDLPKQVIGIISDCAYSSFKEQIKYTLKTSYHLPAFPVINIVNMNLKHKLGISFEDETPLEAVKSAKVPMLFIHGENDVMVPSYFVDELYNACTSKKMLYKVENANHAESVALDIDKYFTNIKEFFNL